MPTATGPKSILKKGSRYSTGTPVHYVDTTESAMTPYTVPSQPAKNVKISELDTFLPASLCTAVDRFLTSTCRYMDILSVYVVVLDLYLCDGVMWLMHPLGNLQN